MRKILIILAVLLTTIANAQMSVIGDTAEIVGGGSFGQTLLISNKTASISDTVVVDSLGWLKKRTITGLAGLSSIDATNISQVEFRTTEDTIKESFGHEHTEYALTTQVSPLTDTSLWSQTADSMYMKTASDLGMQNRDIQNADSIHANWYGGSNFELGESGSTITVDADSVLLTTTADIENNSTALVDANTIYDYINGITAITDNYVVVGTGTAIEGTSALQFDGGMMTITPPGTDTALYIDQNNEEIAMLIDSEATTDPALWIRGFAPIAATQDVANGYGLTVGRNEAEAGRYPLVILTNSHASDTNATISLQNAGSGAHIITASENEDLEIVPNGTGVITVTGTTNYEDYVTDDDDIPNKKYVDDAISAEIQTAKVSLTSFDVNDLGTAKTLISAPAAGTFIQIIAVSWYMDVATQLEVGVQSLDLYIDSGKYIMYSIPNAEVENATSEILQLNSDGRTNHPEIKAAAAYKCVLSATTNPASGSATMDFYITYRIVTL
jgi:hypothetical protein